MLMVYVSSVKALPMQMASTARRSRFAKRLQVTPWRTAADSIRTRIPCSGIDLEAFEGAGDAERAPVVSAPKIQA
jgi:hypothetical protein